MVGTLFVCIRSYALIMTHYLCWTVHWTDAYWEWRIHWLLRFLSLYLTFFPCWGRGNLIPWTVITALMGSHGLALGLLVVYLVITVVRNIIEPKIVGSQIGLHPVVTLVSMFCGSAAFGVLGLFRISHWPVPAALSE